MRQSDRRRSRSTPKDAGAESALFADLKAGWNIAGIPQKQWKDIPDEADFQKGRIARKVGRHSRELSQMVLEDTRNNDFECLRQEFASVTRERWAEGIVQNRKLDAFHSFRPVAGAEPDSSARTRGDVILLAFTKLE